MSSIHLTVFSHSFPVISCIFAFVPCTNPCFAVPLHLWACEQGKTFKRLDDSLGEVEKMRKIGLVFMGESANEMYIIFQMFEYAIDISKP
jgi:hypothetical protein